MSVKTADTTGLPRSKWLKAQTGETHDRLDHRVMATAPFASRANYARFLTVQYRFHRDVDPLYRHPALETILPDLHARNRLGKLVADLADLEQPVPAAEPPCLRCRRDRCTDRTRLALCRGRVESRCGLSVQDGAGA